MRFGYACINLTLASDKIQVNRSMMKKTFLEKGIAHASALALANMKDMERIIDWNIWKKMLLYRMSSEMFPWMSEYEITDLPDYQEIRKIANRCGQKAARAGLRLTFHPGPFNVLASNSALVLQKTIRELRQHAEIMDLLKLEQSPFSKINIHVGGAFGDKQAAMERFAEHYMALPDNTRKRLTVENDDKANMYSVRDLLWLHAKTGIPIVFDYFHHGFCTGGWSEEAALLAAVKTWPAGIPPVVHFSSSKKMHEDPAAPATSHADYIYERVQKFGIEADIMFEAKAKEHAVLKYLKENKE